MTSDSTIMELHEQMLGFLMWGIQGCWKQHEVAGVDSYEGHFIILSLHFYVRQCLKFCQCSKRMK